MTNTKKQAWIFDMDGTLVRGNLDFTGLKRKFGFSTEQPILESIEALEDEEKRKQLHMELEDYELGEVDGADLFPGVAEFLAELKSEGHYLGLVTRNSETVTEKTLKKFNLSFDEVVTRHSDLPPKPSGAAIIMMLDKWQVPKEQAIFIGDYHFDLDAALDARVPGVLFWPKTDQLPPWSKKAKHIFHCFREFRRLRKLGELPFFNR